MYDVVMVRAVVVVEGCKPCGRCKQVKPVAEFYLNPKTVSGYSSYCRPCATETKAQSNKAAQDRDPDDWKKRRSGYVKSYKLRHPERVRDYQRGADIRRNYGMTVTEYADKLAAQGGACVICQKTPEENGRPLPVDHDHETGKTRDILCDSCNKALGFIREDREIAKKMIRYLKKWGR